LILGGQAMNLSQQQGQEKFIHPAIRTICNTSQSLAFKQLPRVDLQQRKYLMPLDRKMRRQIGPLSKEYPKAE